ncbi:MULTISPECIES: hypothetical protein [Levilactobacillus]|uniref:hypothetical protein n=1 Tax=Levilactobacillus TaxID=2767886 RepID=UPI00194E972D|nr:hypothetical protein [Levilactobacillus sp. 244-2]
MKLGKIGRLLGIVILGLLLGVVTETSITAPTNASAATKAISFREAKRILKRSGYSSELGYAKLKHKTHAKTIIYTYPGAKGMDKFSLHPYGKSRVKIYASFGTLDTGHFTKISYIHLPKYKVVKR